jgi:hypothetical protein
LTDPGGIGKRAHENEHGDNGERVGRKRIVKILGKEIQGRSGSVQIGKSGKPHKSHRKGNRHPQEKQDKEQADTRNPGADRGHPFTALENEVIALISKARQTGMQAKAAP